jgi:hypothetical protein
MASAERPPQALRTPGLTPNALVLFFRMSQRVQHVVFCTHRFSDRAWLWRRREELIIDGLVCAVGNRTLRDHSDGLVRRPITDTA